jgi:CDP-diglyceride synthetase
MRTQWAKLDNDTKQMLFVVAGFLAVCILATGVVSIAIADPTPVLSMLLLVGGVVALLGVFGGLLAAAKRLFPEQR